MKIFMVQLPVHENFYGATSGSEIFFCCNFRLQNFFWCSFRYLIIFRAISGSQIFFLCSNFWCTKFLVHNFRHLKFFLHQLLVHRWCIQFNSNKIWCRCINISTNNLTPNPSTFILNRHLSLTSITLK